MYPAGYIRTDTAAEASINSLQTLASQTVYDRLEPTPDRH